MTNKGYVGTPALDNETVKGVFRSIGDAGDSPSNISGETLLKKIERLFSEIVLASGSNTIGNVGLVSYPDTTQITLKENTTETSSWTDPGVDVSAYNECYLHIDITDFDRTDGDELLVLEIEISHDNSTWIHRYTVVDEVNAGDNVTVTGDPDRGKIKETGDYHAFLKGGLGKYMRIKGTLTGTTPSVTLSVIGNFK